MKKILIVDDSSVSRKMLRKLLETEGFEVIGEAVNGREGYEQYKKLSPDVVTMDITMPEMNGMEALKLIKEYDEGAKVVLITAAGQDEKRNMAKELGAVHFLSKPFNNTDIVDAINRI